LQAGHYGEDLRQKPLLERKQKLKALIPKVPRFLFADHLGLAHYPHLARHCTHLLPCPLAQNFMHSQPFFAFDCAHASPPDTGGFGANASNIASATPVKSLTAIPIGTSLAQALFVQVDEQTNVAACRWWFKSREMVNAHGFKDQ
jgi:hypothetical protein